MKNLFILFLASIICVAFIQVNISGSYSYFNQLTKNTKTYKSNSPAGCSPNLSAIDFNATTNSIPLLDGWGNHRMPVTSGNDSANIFFQQGVNMYYGFHIIEAMASFEKSIRFDDTFAMGYWGKALAFGPNINDIGYAASADAIIAVQKAKSLYSHCTAVEKALIDAMETRYSPDTSQQRDHLNQLYADAMKKVHIAFPTSSDAAALYADALMIQHPWDLYDKYYNPKQWTPRIVEVLEKLVEQFPGNPGASHYYIHAIEGSKHPEKGLKVANRLGSLMPGLAHLVHMPSHIYIRSGYYSEGAEVNENAVKGYYNYFSKFPVTANNAFLYLSHNRHMQAACAAMDGQFVKALKYSNDTQSSVDSIWIDGGGYFGVYAQFMYMSPYLSLVRFGKWDELLAAQPVADSRVYANAMWRFARGLAYARKHQFENADKELQKMLANKSNPQLQESPTAFNPGIAAVEVAERILKATVAEEKNQLPDAIKLLKEAVNREDSMLYNEPKDWLLPARQYLGNALLKAKQYSEAEQVFKQDLTINPHNAWSLTGLRNALANQGKKKEQMAVEQKVKKALSRSDTQITSSVF
ncbi:MAG: hypothetical protein H7122_19650 [Chitinophagaceae bacterium]|nr:hypothetical protein [Chitinophagaceae bacterium]